MEEDIPIAASGQYFIPEETVAEETLDERPLIEKIADKNWKTRCSAYEELKRTIISGSSPADPIFSEFGPWLTKMTADSNAGALDAGLDAALSFADLGEPSITLNHIDKLLINIVDKSFPAKTSTANKGKQLILKLMEISDPTVACTFMLSKLGDKKPKTAPTCLEIIKSGVAMFGIQPFPVKEIIKAMPAVFNGTNGPAREAAMALIVEMHRWVGIAPLQSMLDSLRTAQKSDFEKIISEEIESAPLIPTLYLRKDRPLPGQEVSDKGTVGGAKGAAKSGGVAGASKNSGDMSREYVDDVDLMKKVKASEFAALVAEEKWSEQLRGLQLVIDFIGPTPKIKPGSDVHDIVQVCKGFLRQGHVQLQVSSLKILLLLADGMRGEFSTAIRPLTQAIIMKVKEKRLVPDVQATLKMIVIHCLPFDSLCEDVLEIIKNKKEPIHSKVGLTEFIQVALTNVPEKVSNDCLKSIGEALTAVCEDSDPKVRDAVAAALALWASVVKGRGKAANDALKIFLAMENAVPKVFKKIQQLISGGASSGGSAAGEDVIAAPPTKVSKVPASSKSASTTSSSAVSASSAPNATKKAPAKGSSAASSSASSSNANSKKSSAINEEDTVDDLALSFEQAKEILEGLGVENWGSVSEGTVGSMHALMASSKWQEKVEALTTIEKKLIEVKTGGGKYSAALVGYLSSQTGGFKISNINILKAVIAVAVAAAQNCGEEKFSKPAAWELLKQFGDKLSDKKTKDLVQVLLTSLSECITPLFVVKRMKSVLDKVKAPVAHSYYLEWLKDAIKDFGYGAFPIQFLASFCQEEMENKAAGVRTAAIEVMGALYHQVGPKLLAFAISDEMKPQIKSLLEAEFAKVGHDPTAGLKATRQADGADNVSGVGSIPRQDLPSMLDKNILGEMNSIEGKNSWTNRKAAIEAVIAACEKSGHYLDYNKQTLEILKGLKGRINDTQANLKPLAVTAIGHVISSMESDAANKALKQIAGSLLLGLADNKKPMRDATVSSLQMIVLGYGNFSAPGNLANSTSSVESTASLADAHLLTTLVAPISESLANVVGRVELLGWLLLHVEVIKGGDSCTELVAPLIVCMQDKTAAVRTQAEQLLTVMMIKALISKTTLDKATRDLPPATKRSLQPSIDKMMASHGAGTNQVQASSSQPQSQAQPSANMKGKILTKNSFASQSLSDDHNSDESVAEEQYVQPPVVAKRPAPAAPISKVPTSKAMSTNPEILRSASSDQTGQWLLKKATTGKMRRLEEFYKLNWPQPPEFVGEGEFLMLKATWEPLLTPDLACLLFPSANSSGPGLSQDFCISAMNELTTQLECPHFLQHSDLILRWCACILCLRESSTGLLRLLQLVTDVFAAVKNNHHSVLHDSETSSILPHLIDRCGHKSERHKGMFKLCISAASEIIAPNKINQHFIQGLSFINKKSRIVCLEEIIKVVETTGVASLGRVGVKEIAGFLDAKDNDTAGKHACLELIFVIYVSLGSDTGKLHKLLGEISDKSLQMIEDRIRNKLKQQQQQQQAHVRHPSMDSISSVVSMVSMVTVSTAIDTVREAESEGFSPASTQQSSTYALSPMHSPSKSQLAIRALKLDEPLLQPENSPISAANFAPDDKILKEIDAVFASTPLRGNASHSSSVSQSHGMSVSGSGSVSSASVILQSMKKVAAENNVATPYTANRQMAAMAYKSPAMLEFDLETIYMDVGKKLDALLSSNNCLSESDPIMEEAKDYLKIVHSIINDEWSTEKHADDDIILLYHAENLTKKLVRCISRAFNFPSQSTSNTLINQLGFDVPLLAITLSTIYSLVKRNEVVATLTEKCIYECLYECFLRLCDARLSHPNLKEDSTNTAECTETSQSLVRALNLIIMKLSSEANTSLVLSILLQIIFLCIPSSEVTHEKGQRPLPSACTKPISRLVVRILTDEAKKPNPYSEATFNLTRVLEGIHTFFLKHPANTSDDTPFRTAKTILNEVIKALGGYHVLTLLQSTTIPANAFIFILTSRLGNVTISETNTELHGKLVAVIENITSARDKVAAIRELHKIKKENPNLDINLYLHKISSAFRRFVLDTLSKLDMESQNPMRSSSVCMSELSNSPSNENENINVSNTVDSRGTAIGSEAIQKPSIANASQQAPAVPQASSSDNIDASALRLQSSNAIINNSVTSKATEAMRILEGLKSRPNSYRFPPTTPTGGSGKSMFVASLSASQELPPDAGHFSAAEMAASLLKRRQQTLSLSNNSSDNIGQSESNMDEADNAVSTPLASQRSSLANRGLATGGASPFSRRNDLIRDSLINLTASLELPNPPPIPPLPPAVSSVNNNNNNNAASAAASPLAMN